MPSKVFISHKHTDEEVAGMIFDFLVLTGIPRESIYCTSLPGNDVEEKIPNEVKSALKDSAVNIAILSQEYYQSAYCLNEAGIIWYNDDVPAILIALPEINEDNISGFFSKDDKLRRLDNDADISYICSKVKKALSAEQSDAIIVTQETKKLIKRYDEYIKSRKSPEPCTPTVNLTEITTDDERIVLYCILKNNIYRISKDDIIAWLRITEIYGVNVDNAFHRLSSLDGISVNTDNLEFSIEAFQKYSEKSASILPELKKCVDRHTKLASDTFKSLWDTERINPTLGLFIAYIVDEKINSFVLRNEWTADLFGKLTPDLFDQWAAKDQAEDIRQWEDKNSLRPRPAINYRSCLETFILYNLVYESACTNSRTIHIYTLNSSLRDLLFNLSKPYSKKLEQWKREYRCK